MGQDVSPAARDERQRDQEERVREHAMEERASRFTYHPPTPAGITRHADLAAAFIALAALVDEVVPAGYERALVHTKLQEGKFWASAGIARNPSTR